MNNNMINLLEKLRLGENVTAEEFLSENDITQIKEWYNRYSSNNKFTTTKVIDLMFILYHYENIDIYPIDEYRKRVIPLAENHAFKPERFLELLTDFRKIVFD